MVELKNVDTISSELENRLDDLFGENDVPLPEVNDKNREEHYPLADLKNLILSIDWEITDEVLEKFLQQLKDLQLTYEHDKIVMTFLQILNSLGNYIKTNRAKAHPRTFKILNSVFSSLDKVVLSRDMAEPAKKKILRAEMNRYKELRTQIAKSKGTAVSRKPKPIAKPSVTEVPETKDQEEEPIVILDDSSQSPIDAAREESPITLQEPEPEAVVTDLADAAREELPITLQEPEPDAVVANLADAVKELKRYIHTEIKSLKEEIQALREQH